MHFCAFGVCGDLPNPGARSAIYEPNEDFQRAAAECACAPYLGSFAKISTAEYRPWLEIIDSEIRSTLNADISA